MNRQNDENRDYSGTAELLANEIGLIRYSTYIVKRFYKAMDLSAKKTVIEFGAGTGFLAELLREKWQVVPACVELDPKLCKVIEEKGIVSKGNITNI